MLVLQLAFFFSLLHRMLTLTASLSASSLSRTWWALPLVARPGVALCPSSPPLLPSCHAPTTRSAWLPSPSPMSISVGPMLASPLVSHPSNGWGVYIVVNGIVNMVLLQHPTVIKGLPEGVGWGWGGSDTYCKDRCQ